MLTRMARMARMLTRMTRWLAYYTYSFHFVGATFRPQEFIRNLEHFVLQYFCNFTSPKNPHLPVGQVKHRIL